MADMENARERFPSHNSRPDVSEVHEIGYIWSGKISSAVFYAISSMLMIFANKAILTSYNFPYFHFLATMQFVVTVIILYILSWFGKIQIPYLTWETCKQVVPISLLFLVNILCGLASTRSLSLPMMTALRRFSILMTMLGEWAFLNARPSSAVVYSVVLMIGGACVAAMYDLSFDIVGYSFIFLNDVFTAAYGVFMKKATISGKCSPNAILFYNSMLSALFMVLYFILEDMLMKAVDSPSSLQHNIYDPFTGSSHMRRLSANDTMFKTLRTSLFKSHSQYSEHSHSSHRQNLDDTLSNRPNRSILEHADLENFHNTHLNAGGHSIPIQLESAITKVYNFELWADPHFLLMFSTATMMGCILNYAIFLCTTKNSALTTSVIGALKNIAVTYIGMMINDYRFSWINFIGINISITGSLYYTHVTLLGKGKSSG